MRISIDISNRCSKECDFCYNGSHRAGGEVWQPDEVVRLMRDCAENGLKAVSLGGGEPFEYPGIFYIIANLTPILFVSVTTNGIPLQNSRTWDALMQNKPDKIHITVHNPENDEETCAALHFIGLLKKEGIRAGVNLLISSNKIPAAKRLFCLLEENGISRNEVILIPRKYNLQPSPQEVAEVAGNKPFQAPTCLNVCRPSKRFVSVSWDKCVSFCSYSPSRAAMETISYKGITDALRTITFKTCRNEGFGYMDRF
ncbi:MAG: radical SAM protein [Tannerellaceae bacterium]|jgi:MoaA/NifB/PqqE/SkfB family radical SAM enzyme|nr:radical SAM protein [Tannerellaceae bacterium]